MRFRIDCHVWNTNQWIHWTPISTSAFCRLPLFCFNPLLPILLLLLLIWTSASGQQDLPKDTTAVEVVDVVDVLQHLFKIKEKPDSNQSPSSVSILPVIGYNPSLGGVIGVNTVIGRQFGDPQNTGYSVYTLGLTYSTKGILTIQARHNIFRPQNKWNIQGNWQLSLYGLIDYGLGTGSDDYCYDAFVVGDYPLTESDSTFPTRYRYIRFYEKIYYSFARHIYVGGGMSFDIYDDIEESRLQDLSSTPHTRYSDAHNFSSTKYSANGLLVAFQFNSREHPIRSYGGTYFDLNFRFNQKWMASTKNSIQLIYDFRKYISLSSENPEHVLAFWHWASYLLSGELPYLELPYTGSDTYNRSGRAYTIGRFRGQSYAYFETEYRFPITRNKLISGVCFMNFHSAADDNGKKVYNAFNYGGGAGLRFLFQKRSRSALCVDFSYGNCGSKGVFFGLNEAF